MKRRFLFRFALLFRENLLIPFFISLAALILAPIFFPSLHLHAFAPFLVILAYTHSFSRALWQGALMGCLVDLLSGEERMGVYALSFVLTMGVLFRLRRFFFSQATSTLPLLTGSVSLLLSLEEMLILHMVNGKPFSLSWEWVEHGLILSAGWDALFAAICFSLPIRIFFPRGLRSREGKRAAEVRFRRSHATNK